MRVLDLFSGIGGFSLGLERAGMRTVAFCEIEPYCRAVLKKHWPDVPIFEDVTNLKARDVGPVDVICGGFPCQDISYAGKGAGLGGERSGLWYEFHRLIEESQPRYAIIENVSALRSRGLDAVLGSLAAIGYDAEWHCIPAAAVGAPHRRDRIWIVAYPNGEGKHDGAIDAEMGGAQESLAHAHQPRLEGWLRAELRERAGQFAAGAGGAFPDADSHAGIERWSGDASEGEGGRDADRAPIARPGAAQWLVEPDVGRVANGVPSRVDRLRSLGNAVVPQIPEMIGRAIMATL